MDYEVELNYRLTGHLQPEEIVLATLISPQQGIYAATDRRILGVHNEAIGYRMRIYAYGDLDRVECAQELDVWLVEFCSADRRLSVPARSRGEARRFVETVSELIDRSKGGRVGLTVRPELPDRGDDHQVSVTSDSPSSPAISLKISG